MNEPIAYLNGEFLPASQLHISPDDLGFMMGVAISERLRTFGGKLFHLDAHLGRLANSLKTVELEIDLDLDRLGAILEHLVVANLAGLSPHDDLGIALFVTPGTLAAGRATIGIQAYPLPFGQWADHYERGQSLVETGVRQVPSSCWPLGLKCRSRMHYYLADRLAAKQDSRARAILLDQAGFISEASTANVLIYRSDVGIVSPPLEHILPGVSLSVLARLADEIGLDFSYRRFRLEEVAAAEEVLLCSTSPCVWPATHLNGQSIGSGAAGSVFRRLLTAWSDLVGLDIAAQAGRFSERV